MTGEYTMSTRGRTLAEEGFIHASRRDQVQQTFNRFFKDADEPLLLLRINPAKLTSQVRLHPVDGDTFPHIHGPMNLSAVEGVLPLTSTGASESFTSLFVKEMAVRIGFALLAMFLAFGGAELGRRFGPEAGGAMLGALAGLAVGGLIGFVHQKRRETRG